MTISKKEMESWTSLNKEQIDEQSNRCAGYIKTFDSAYNGIQKAQSELFAVIEKENGKVAGDIIDKILDDARGFALDANRAIYNARHIVSGDPYFWRGEFENQVDERLDKNELVEKYKDYMVKIAYSLNVKDDDERKVTKNKLAKMLSAILNLEENIKEAKNAN